MAQSPHVSGAAPADDPQGSSAWTHRHADVNGVRLHYVEAGRPGGRPTVILLHGFPEFWYSWRHQIPALAAAGFHVVAPDMRGYNTSDKPPRVRDYRVETLVGDVVALARHVGAERVHLAGHDWGGVVAWLTAMWRPDAVDRLAVLNVPHPIPYFREVRRGFAQLLRSWYVFFFQLPWLPEAWLALDDFEGLKRILRHEPARRGAYTEADVRAYTAAWSRPGAMRAGVNYYRAAARRGPGWLSARVRHIDRPTLLVWGMRDRYLVPQLTEGLEPWVSDLRVERLAHATHWVQHDEPDLVSRLLIEHFRGAAAVGGAGLSGPRGC